jgi:hypothetical protein
MGNDPELGLILHSHSKRLLFETHVHHTSTWRCDPGTFLAGGISTESQS